MKAKLIILFLIVILIFLTFLAARNELTHRRIIEAQNARYELLKERMLNVEKQNVRVEKLLKKQWEKKWYE